MLTPAGIYQRGRAFSSYLPWEAFAGAKASDDGLTPYVLVIDCTVFAPDHNLIYHLVKFYVDNPQTRAELGTEAVIQRARAGAFS